MQVDLRPGNWSTFSAEQLAELGFSGEMARGNVANALLFQGNAESLMENAIGGAGDDTLIGNAADNRLQGKGGNDSIDGQGGLNTAVFSGPSTSYSISDLGSGHWSVTDLRPGSPDGTDTLSSIQQLEFSDGLVTLTGASASKILAHQSSSSVSASTQSTETRPGAAARRFFALRSICRGLDQSTTVELKNSEGKSIFARCSGKMELPHNWRSSPRLYRQARPPKTERSLPPLGAR